MTTNNKGLARKGWFYWNEGSVNGCPSINWRESLVLVAVVIPAPIVYIRFVAVEKLVVESEAEGGLLAWERCLVDRSFRPNEMLFF